VFLCLKMFALNAYSGDEHIYVYQARAVAAGAVPYRDFSMAHPPLQTLTTAALFAVLGYSFLLARLLPVLWCLAGGVVLGVMVRRELGTVASVASVALALWSYEPLRASSHFTGVNMTVTLLLSAFVASRAGRLRAGAVLCVAAMLTRLYAAPAVLALTLWVLLERGWRGLRLVGWGAAVGVVAFAGVGGWTGFGVMIDNVVAYHVGKTPMDPETLSEMKAAVLFHNAVPAALALLGGAAALATAMRRWASDPERGPWWPRLRTAVASSGVGLALLGTVTALLFVAPLLRMDRVWTYYFVAPFWFGAIPGGYLIGRWIDGAVRLARARGRLAASGLGPRELAAGATLAGAWLVAIALAPGLESRLDYWKREMARPAEQRVVRYTWADGRLPGFLNALVRRTLWSDERAIGRRYLGFTYLLWHESRHLEGIDRMVQEVLARTGPDDAIFGDSGTVPLLALLADRRVAANEADTNIQQYRSGRVDPDDLVRRIDRPDTRLIVLRDDFGIAGLDQLRRLVRREYREVATFPGSGGRVYRFYQRREADR